MEDQKHKENQSQQASQTSPVGNGEGMGSSCAQTEKTELNICTFPLVCLYSSNAVNVVQHLTFISQRTLQVSSYNFSHIRLS